MFQKSNRLNVASPKPYLATFVLHFMEKLLKLFEYTFWANDQFIVRVQEQVEIPEEINKQISHVLAAHRTWLERINGRGTLPSIWNEIEPNTWEGINIELYNESCDLLKSKQLSEIVSFKNSHNNFFENELGDILHHLINHNTHHRAQIALLMRKHQILPPKTDYIFYLHSL